MVDVSYFLNNDVQEIYKKERYNQVFIILKFNRYSCSFLFVFICYDTCSIKKSHARNLIFEILRKSKIAERLDSSHEIWLNYDFYKKELYKKQDGLYEIESIDNPNLVTISISPKEYYK